MAIMSNWNCSGFTIFLPPSFPTWPRHLAGQSPAFSSSTIWPAPSALLPGRPSRSEEHTSELQSPCNLVCRLLLEKKKKKTYISDSADQRAPTAAAPEPAAFRELRSCLLLVGDFAVLVLFLVSLCFFFFFNMPPPPDFSPLPLPAALPI